MPIILEIVLGWFSFFLVPLLERGPLTRLDLELELFEVDDIGDGGDDDL